MNLSVTFDPLLPVLVIAILAVIGVGILLFAALKRARGWWLRGIALTLLLASLTNPTLRNEEREPLRNIGLIIVDRTDSQNIGNRLEQVDQAAKDLKERAATLNGLDLRFVTVQGSTDDGKGGTRLFAALDRAMSDIPADRFAGAVLLTDGEVHDVPDTAAQAKLRGPVHALIAGSQNELDRRVVIDQAPRFGIVGSPQTIRFHVEQSGGDKSPVEVAIRIGRNSTQTMSVKPGDSVSIDMPIDHAGENAAELAVAAVPGELTTDNNRALAIVNGVRDRLRVLLISGEPHPGERTWRNMLKADAAVDLVHFTILRPPDKQDGTPVNELSLIAFPTRELFVEKIREFDLVIFDRYHREAIIPDEYVQQIADYVKQGGALLVSSGPEFAEFDGLYSTPLSQVLAASPTGEVLNGPYKPEITDTGKRHPVTAGLAGPVDAEPSWGRWFRGVETNADGKETVMSGLGDKPLLVLSHQGEGRSAQLLSDQSWLWARGFEGGGPQSELLRRMAHWLMKEPSLEEEALTGKLNGNGLTVERRTMEDTAPPVTVTGPGGQAQQVQLTQVSPGLWRGSVATNERGLFLLDDGKLKSFAVAAVRDSRETSDIVATATKLAPTVEVTGGNLAWLEDGLPQLQLIAGNRPLNASGTFGFRSNSAYRVVAASAFPLFASLAALSALLALLAGIWFREGR